MTKTVAQRRAENGETGESRNARLSLFLRSKRPIPTTRREADGIYAPHAQYAPATLARLYRLNAMGLLELRTTPGESITQGQAHEAILDAIYGPEEPHEQAVEGDGV